MTYQAIGVVGIHRVASRPKRKRVAYRYFVLSFIGCCYFGAMDSGRADVLRWKFEATVVVLDDPQMGFGDVRLGDTMRGIFGYDLALEPMPGNTLERARYEHAPTFTGIQLEIVNPRTDENLLFLPNPSEAYGVTVSTTSGPYDGSEVLLGEVAIPPTPTIHQWVTMQFAAPDVLEDTSLPTEYDLDDWPLAVVYLLTANFSGYLDAQIYAVTPVTAGDFDGDYDVDGSDFLKWQRGDSSNPLSRNDLVDWQANFSAVAPPSVGSTPIPEPTTWSMLLLAGGAIISGRRPVMSELNWS